MDRDQLYARISSRKRDPRHLQPYAGGNGRIDRFLDMVRSGELPRGGRILDVGGSHGDLVDLALRERLFDTGDVLDISAEACHVAHQRGLVAWRVDVDRDGLTLGTAGRLANYDCIAALDFIEHIVDPGNFARECHRALSPGGYAFINTPNISYWRNLSELVVAGRFPHTSGDTEVYHGGHLAFYNENDMFEIFGAAGFTDMRVYPESTGEPVPPIWERLLFCEPEKRARMLGSPNLLFSAMRGPREV